MTAGLAARPFYYLRHGQTDWNLERRGQGRSDIPLNATGLLQAEKARQLLQGCNIKSIICSPLVRARKTAEIVNEAFNLPIHYVDELQEAAFGEMEGVVAGNWFFDWFEGLTPPGAEPYDSFVRRALAGMNKALAFPGPVLIVAHGGIYWSVQKITGLGERRVVNNCDPVYHEPRCRLDGMTDWHITKLADKR